MANTSTLADAIAHLRDFRATLYDGDEVDEQSHLRAADLDVVLAAAEAQLRADQSASSAHAPDGSLSGGHRGNVV